MNKLSLCLLFSIASFTGFSQKVYFVYLQTESQQPFFVKMNGSIRSSSSSGYIILSKLRDSTYDFTVGFPQNKWPEQHFSVMVNQKDHGYLVKNFGEKGWGLFDLQTLGIQMATGGGSAKMEDKQKEENKDVSIFTDILSKAADDPSLREKTVESKTAEKKVEQTISEIVKKEEPKVEPKETIITKPAEIIEEPVAKKELSAGAKEPIIENKDQSALNTDEVATLATESYKQSVITKRSESSTTEGFGLVFIDDSGNGINDTIRLLIPNPKPVASIVKEEPKEEKKFLDILPDNTKKAEEKNLAIMPVVKENPVEKNVIKNNCVAIAEQSDFFKLRKNLAAADGDDNMIAEARKYFIMKCFTTMQLKNLSLLFLDDAGKYKFFDLAHAYVTDIENFSGLQNELKDENYIRRFKALLRN